MKKTLHNVIDIMEEQKSITNMGGTMRLGAYECVLQEGSKAFENMVQNIFRSVIATDTNLTMPTKPNMKQPV